VTGTEDGASRADNNDFAIGVGFQSKESGPQSFQHLPRESIPFFRMIQSDFADAILSFKSQDSLIHYVTDSVVFDDFRSEKTPKVGRDRLVFEAWSGRYESDLLVEQRNRSTAMIFRAGMERMSRQVMFLALSVYGDEESSGREREFRISRSS